MVEVGIKNEVGAAGGPHKRETAMTQQVKAVLPFGSDSFTFQLCKHEIELGAAGMVQYYWMPIPGLRHPDGVNVRACVDSWWAEVQAQAFSDPDDIKFAEENLALAELYPLVVRHRGPQNVFRDAFLMKGARRNRSTGGRGGSAGQSDYDLDDGELDDRQFTLPDAEWKRLQAMCRQRDVDGIRQEIESLFVGELPPRSEKPRYNEAFDHWTANAVAALRDGRGALRGFLETDLLRWIKLYRRRGGQIRPHLFINMVSHEAKVAFHTCYSNAWMKLTQWLMDNRELDPTSARFMFFWHRQNERDSGRDAFWGHVLALHPLSERVMTQAPHRVAVGQWLRAAAGDPLTGKVVDRDEYWDLVATTLAAGHEYVHLREQANAARRLPSGTPPPADGSSAGHA